MKFVDLQAQHDLLKNDIEAQIQRVLDHGQFVMGEEVFELERELASLTGAKHCITVGNGTDALFIALMALGIGQGDEVIVPVFTFFATVEAVLLTGAQPIFVDIDPNTYTIETQQLDEVVTERTKAIMPVDLYGQCADYDPIWQVAKAHGLAVVADAAQSFGATYKNQDVGTLATVSCTSFFPSKPLGGYGDGGGCFTQDNELAENMRQIREHGQLSRYEHVRLGVNSRLDTLQAAILLVKLKVLEQELKARQKVAAYYNKHLQDKVHIPQVRDECTSAFAQYTIQVSNRDAVQEMLRNAEVPTAVHYPVPLNHQPYFQQTQWYHQRFSQALDASQHVLSLPIHPYLSTKEQDYIIEHLLEALEPLV